MKAASNKLKGRGVGNRKKALPTKPAAISPGVSRSNNMHWKESRYLSRKTNRSCRRDRGKQTAAQHRENHAKARRLLLRKKGPRVRYRRHERMGSGQKVPVEKVRKKCASTATESQGKQRGIKAWRKKSKKNNRKQRSEQRSKRYPLAVAPDLTGQTKHLRTTCQVAELKQENNKSTKTR